MQNVKGFSISLLFSALFAISLNTLASTASKPVALIDTAGPLRKPYRLNEKEFIQRYGNDYTRTIIYHFFSKRKKAFQFIFIPLLADLLAGITFGIVNKSAPDTVGVVIYFILGGLVYATIVLSIIGVISLIIYSRKRLFRLIQRKQQMTFIR